MLTYNRGQWGEDHEIENPLDEAGYPARSWMEPGQFSIEIYSIEENSKYPYAARIQAMEDGLDGIEMEVCITDILSAFMLVKEYLPFVHESREKLLFDMKEEEHWWKAHDENRLRSKYKDPEKCCRHIR